jgi:hypothetical protein
LFDFGFAVSAIGHRAQGARNADAFADMHRFIAEATCEE